MRRSPALIAWLVSVVLCGVLCATASAQALPEDRERMDLAPFVAYLEDPTGQLSIDAVRAADASGAFQPFNGRGAVNFGLSSSAYWLRFDLPSSTTERYLLEVAFYALTEVRLYYPDGTMVATGQHQSASQRPWPHRHPVFPIAAASDEAEQTYFLRVASVGSLTVPLRLWRESAFLEHVQVSYFVLAAYYGAALALLFYNLFLFVSLRERKYLLYCGFLLFLTAAMSILNGFGAYFFEPLGWPARLGTNTFFALSAVFAIWFVRDFLEVKTRLPGIDRLLLGSMFVFLLIAAAPVFNPPIRVVVATISVLGAITAPVLLAVTAWCWRAGDSGARYLLMAWAVMLIAIMIQALRNFGIVPTNDLTYYLLQFGSLLDMLLLSFALADRVQIDRRKREQAQTEAIAAQEALVQGLRASEQRLENEVALRTEALRDALERERGVLNRYVEFGALIGHEFRNPLAIVRNQAESAEMELSRGDVCPAHRITRIRRAAERLQTLFEQWLQSDRLRTPKPALDLERVQLDTWCMTVIRRCGLLSDHRLKTDLQAVTVEMDSALMSLALTNLLDNAAKYSPAESVIRVSVNTTEAEVAVCVADTGAGLSPADQERVFEKHFRSPEARDKAGFGLGLYFVRQVLEAHGGRVTVDSAVGRGTTFSLWLPHQPSER